MDSLKSIILPYLKTYVGFGVAWLTTANIDPHQVSVFLASSIGVTVPDAVAAAAIGLVTAAAVWAVPNKSK